jgi:hypothetical protein
MSTTAGSGLPVLEEQVRRSRPPRVLREEDARALDLLAPTCAVELPVVVEVAHRLAAGIIDGGLDVQSVLRPNVDPDDARYDGGRAYACLVDSPTLEVWLIEWGPAAKLGLHDHGGAFGAAEVLAGGLVETYATISGPRELQSRRFKAGDLYAFPRDHVHEIWNPTGEAALSLHAYSPRLTSMTFYDDRGGVLGAPVRAERYEDI